MIIEATTDHGGIKKGAEIIATRLDEFAAALEKGAAGPIYARAEKDTHLEKVWRDLKGKGYGRYAFTRFSRK